MVEEFGKTFATDSDGDLIINNRGLFVWIRDDKAVIQDLKHTIATIKGEDPFDDEQGLALFEAVGGTARVPRLKFELRTTVEHDNRVNRVENINVDAQVASRKAHVEITVELVNRKSYTFRAIA